MEKIITQRAGKKMRLTAAKGTDIVSLSDRRFGGHKSNKTAKIYTHASKKRLEKIRSPLDSLKLTKGVAIDKDCQ